MRNRHIFRFKWLTNTEASTAPNYLFIAKVANTVKQHLPEKWSWGWRRRNLCLQLLEQERERPVFNPSGRHPRWKRHAELTPPFGEWVPIKYCAMHVASPPLPAIVSYNSLQSVDVNILWGPDLWYILNWMSYEEFHLAVVLKIIFRAQWGI